MTFDLSTMTADTKTSKLAGLSRDCSIGYALNANRIDAILSLVYVMSYETDNGAVSTSSALYFDIERMRVTRNSLITAAQLQ